MITQEEKLYQKSNLAGTAILASEHIGNLLNEMELQTLNALRQKFRSEGLSDLGLTAKLVALDDIRSRLKDQITGGMKAREKLSGGYEP